MMSNPGYIVYIWLLPLVLFIILPLCMFVVYLLGRFIYFMFSPKRMREQDVESTIPERDMGKVL